MLGLKKVENGNYILSMKNNCFKQMHIFLNLFANILYMGDLR